MNNMLNEPKKHTTVCKGRARGGPAGEQPHSFGPGPWGGFLTALTPGA